MVDVERINYLAKKKKEVGLTEAELKEQAELRKAYLEAIRRSMRASLGDPNDYKDKGKN